MILQIENHDFHYEMENLCRVFFPNEKIRINQQPQEGERLLVYTQLKKDDGVDGVLVSVGASVHGRCKSSRAVVEASDEELRDECERAMARELFFVLSALTGNTPSWGILTGVRPSKLMMRLVKKYGERGAVEYFTHKLLVSPEKAKLALSVAQTELGITALGDERSFSLYISVPFCPSRCSYCSFVSHSITNPKAAKLLPDYVEKLCCELEITGELAGQLGLRLESVYIGGGTPGILSADQLSKVCLAVRGSFEMSAVREYTVEIGRPDTVEPQKLEVLRRFDVGRISINPQTLNDSVLQAIGRGHTARDFFSAYELASDFGFENINVDLIAGLPCDTAESFRRSVDCILSLSPADVTVHALALKSASSLAGSGHEVSPGEAGEMVDYSQKALREAGYIPYYMYRQSRCVGNLENVGWCLPGRECLYNVFMMEESHTVLAAGAGAVTKLKKPGADYIERIFNYKYPYEYNTGFDELIGRKARITGFYKESQEENAADVSEIY